MVPFLFALIVYLVRFSTENKGHFLTYVCPTSQLTSNEDRKEL